MKPGLMHSNLSKKECYIRLAFMDQKALHQFLDKQVHKFNNRSFIATDPICIPHGFSLQQDIEIMGFFASIFSWGQRITIIQKSRELASRMGNQPYAFVYGLNHSKRKKLIGFKHRTFNDTDLLYTCEFLHHWYRQNESLETAFTRSMRNEDRDVEQALNGFRKLFTARDDYPERTGKHIASPDRNSACKRLNMFLRWMVRRDDRGVDFGIWKKIRQDQLICPLDVHVQRTAMEWGLLSRKQADWQAAVELTQSLKQFDPLDPVKYDFALFGTGVNSGKELLVQLGDARYHM